MARSPLSRSEKWLFGGCILGLVPVMVVAFVYTNNNRLPPPKPAPKIVLPSPNGFDDWARASLALPAPPKTAKGDWKDPLGGGEANYGTRPYTALYSAEFPLAAKRAYLAQSGWSLKLWRDTIERPYFEESDKYKFRQSLFYTARVQARACWQRGEARAALRWILLAHRQAYRRTTQFFNGKPHARNHHFLSTLERNLRWILPELEALSPHLSPADCAFAARELTRNRALVPSRAAMFETSKRETLERAEKICRDNDWIVTYYGPYDQLDPQVRWKNFRFRWANKAALLKTVAKKWDKAIAAQKSPIFVDLRDDDDPTQDYYSFEAELSESPEQAASNRSSWDSSQDRESVLLTHLALRAFRGLKGRNAKTLQELVPEFLPRVETGGYDQTKPLVYNPKPHTFVWHQRGEAVWKAPLPPDAIPPTPKSWMPEPQPLGYRIQAFRVTQPFDIHVDQYDLNSISGQNQSSFNQSQPTDFQTQFWWPLSGFSPDELAIQRLPAPRFARSNAVSPNLPPSP